MSIGCRNIFRIFPRKIAGTRAIRLKYGITLQSAEERKLAISQDQRSFRIKVSPSSQMSKSFDCGGSWSSIVGKIQSCVRYVRPSAVIRLVSALIARPSQPPRDGNPQLRSIDASLPWHNRWLMHHGINVSSDQEAMRDGINMTGWSLVFPCCQH